MSDVKTTSATLPSCYGSPEVKSDPALLISSLASRGRSAQRELVQMASAQRAKALAQAAAALREHETSVLEANGRDLSTARANGISEAMIDRLALDPARLEGIAAAVEAIAALPDPVGQIIDQTVPPNGLKLSRVRVPLGLIGIIYESRPNVTADTAALCVRSGNAVLLRGGTEAVHSNSAIHRALVVGLTAEGVPEDAVQLVPVQDRAAVGAMLRAHGEIDMIVPRGGRSLVERVQKDARVPVLAHLDGLCHTYIHAAADPAMAQDIVCNAKMRRTGICGALETLLIDVAYPHSASLIGALMETGCEVRGDERVRELDPRVLPASADDWDTEYLAPIVSVAMVDGLDTAIMHIARHSSDHTDAIVTDDQSVAEQFLAQVDSAIVMHNASSQFADGGEFGLGAEIGIATGRLHARGPVALEGLTTYKWQVRGSGQTRP
ncbi:MAG: glutamate-5-semialdehyde dehydrogenase [Pseudomonadota bacterium]